MKAISQPELLEFRGNILVMLRKSIKNQNYT
jgi:hypothetical protein